MKILKRNKLKLTSLLCTLFFYDSFIDSSEPNNNKKINKDQKIVLNDLSIDTLGEIAKFSEKEDREELKKSNNKIYNSVDSISSIEESPYKRILIDKINVKNKKTKYLPYFLQKDKKIIPTVKLFKKKYGNNPPKNLEFFLTRFKNVMDDESKVFEKKFYRNEKSKSKTLKYFEEISIYLKNNYEKNTRPYFISLDISKSGKNPFNEIKNYYKFLSELINSFSKKDYAKIKKINLSNNDISLASIEESEELIESLLKNKDITDFYANNCDLKNLEDDLFDEFTKILTKNNNIITLELNRNNLKSLESKKFIKIMNEIGNLKNLKNLDLSENDIENIKDRKMIQSLIDSLKKLNGLTDLKIFNIYGKDYMKFIKTLKKENLLKEFYNAIKSSYININNLSMTDRIELFIREIKSELNIKN